MIGLNHLIKTTHTKVIRLLILLILQKQLRIMKLQLLILKNFIIKQLFKVIENKKFKKNKCDLFDNPYNTINIGTINGGESINTTSDFTKVLLDFRITNNKKDIMHIKKYIDKLILKYPKTEYKVLNEINPLYSEDRILKLVYLYIF